MPGDAFPFPLLNSGECVLEFGFVLLRSLADGPLLCFPACVSRSFKLRAGACFPGCPVTSHVRRPLVSCWLDVSWLLEWARC